MKRITLCSIFLIWLINAVYCKKYLVEVDDGQWKNSEVLGDRENGNGEAEVDLEEELDEVEKGQDFEFLTTCLRCHERKLEAKKKECFTNCCHACRTKRKNMEKTNICLKKRGCLTKTSRMYW